MSCNRFPDPAAAKSMMLDCLPVCLAGGSVGAIGADS